MSDRSNELQRGIISAQCLFLNHSGAGTEAGWELKRRIPSPIFRRPHLGGGATGPPGHNAAREIVRDFRPERSA